MSNFLSKLLDSLRKGGGSGGDRREAPRFHLEERLTIAVTRPNVGTRPSSSPTSIYGYTRDVSEAGLAFVLPELSVGGYKFTTPGRTMRITLKLPRGTVEMQVAYVRDAPLEGEAGYLVGVRIVEMTPKDRALYHSFLKTLGWVPQPKPGANAGKR